MIAIVPKLIHTSYTNCYGSHFELDHIRYCIDNRLEYKIINQSEFFNTFKKYDSVLFIGLSQSAKNFIQQNNNIKKYIWSNNIVDSYNNPKIYDNVDVIFEQSILHNWDREFVYVPTGFQSNRSSNKDIQTEYDIMFNGSVYRIMNNPLYRIDVLKGILENGLKIIHYNGGYNKPNEKQLIDKHLKKYSNYTLVNKWSEPYHYKVAKYTLDMPFMCKGSFIDNDWGKDFDNKIWFHGWDIFRAIGAKTNLITYRDEQMFDIGLDGFQCSFYGSDCCDVEFMVNEIVNIVTGNVIKNIDDNTWFQNTYVSRWNKIIQYIGDNY